MLIVAAYPPVSGTFAGKHSPRGSSRCLDSKETSTLGPTLFKPSINWSSALVDSLQWVAVAWAVGAVEGFATARVDAARGRAIEAWEDLMVAGVVQRVGVLLC